MTPNIVALATVPRHALWRYTTEVQQSTYTLVDAGPGYQTPVKNIHCSSGIISQTSNRNPETTTPHTDSSMPILRLDRQHRLTHVFVRVTNKMVRHESFRSPDQRDDTSRRSKSRKPLHKRPVIALSWMGHWRILPLVLRSRGCQFGMTGAYRRYILQHNTAKFHTYRRILSEFLDNTEYGSYG
jgi:hypothetical protein